MDSKVKTQNKAWVLRETGKPLGALALLFPLLYTYETDSKWDLAGDVLIQITICWKILGRQENEPLYFQAAIETLNRIKTISKIYKVPLRADWAYYLGEVQMAAGNFKEAAKTFQDYLKGADLAAEHKADIKAQIGYARAKTGDKKGGIKLLRESVYELEHPTRDYIHQERDVHAIWKLGAQLKLAQVLGKSEEAIQIVKEVLLEAKAKRLGARERQAKVLLTELKKL